MQKPTLRETLPRLVEQGVITAGDVKKYLANYEYFEQNRSYIEQSYPGKWVASLNNELFVGSWHHEVRDILQGKPHERFAYIEQIV